MTELSNESITRNYRYIRMERECLLPLDLNDVAYGLSVNAKKVWKPFIEIIVYTVHQIHKRTT